MNYTANLSMFAGYPDLQEKYLAGIQEESGCSLCDSPSAFDEAEKQLELDLFPKTEPVEPMKVPVMAHPKTKSKDE